MLHVLRPDVRPSADFDFLLGIWSCQHRYLVRRLVDCHDWIEFGGTCAVRKVLDGFGQVDESEIAFPGERYRSMNLRIYDAGRERWSIHWFDSRRPGRSFLPVVGRFAKDIGTFYGEDEWERHTVRVRFLWSRITPNSARWEQAFSIDSGVSWETNWIVDFNRI